MNERRRLTLLALTGAALAALGAWSRWPATPRAPAHGEYLRSALGPAEDDADFARAETRRDFAFPRDHGPHPDYRAEWWYFTGHLATAAARPFGFQLTLFRFELARRTAASTSAWRTPRVILAHFALTDIAGARFHAFERMSRALPGIAGTSDDPPAIWLDDWRIAFQADGDSWLLNAAHDGVALALTLAPRSPVIAQGDGGLSRKSAARGNASYYYSIPRLAARGRVHLPGATLAVTGTAWLDREWSTSALDREQVGWDWFALQLDDGSNLMFYRLRRRDGNAAPHSAGSYTSATGTLERLAFGDVVIEELGQWTSPQSGTRYPSAWRLTIAPAGLVLELKPVLAAQEWRARLSYWEGAVSVADARGAARGRGYVELTGY